MANADSPRGFWPTRHMCGGQIRTKEYTLTTGATAYQGDLMKIVAAGTVEAATVDIGLACIGVAAEYVTDSGSAGNKKILVYDDPYIAFGIQMDDAGTASTAADVGQTANHLAGAGSATTKISGHELDMSDIGTGAQLKIVGLIDEPNNAWGANCDVEVLINEHFYKAAVAGV